MNIFEELEKIGGVQEIGYEIAAENLLGAIVIVTAKVIVSPSMLQELQEQWNDFCSKEGEKITNKQDNVYVFDVELTDKEMEMADKAIKKSPPDHSVLDSIAGNKHWWIDTGGRKKVESG